MDSKAQSHVDGLNAAACKSQGGGNRDQGPSGASDPKASGDSVTNPTFYTKQDASREQGGGVKNKYHDV